MVIDFNIRVKVRLAGDEFYGEEGIVVRHQPSYSIPNGVAFGAKRIRYYGDNELEVLDKFCAVCDQHIASDTPYVHHSRLNVNVHFGCPKNDVCGEDITTHTMQFVNLDKVDDWSAYNGS